MIIIHIDGNSTVIRQCYENSSSRRETSRIYQEEERTAGIDLAVKISKISFSFLFLFLFLFLSNKLGLLRKRTFEIKERKDIY